MSRQHRSVAHRGGNVAAGPRVLHVYRTYFPETQGGLQEAIRQICRGVRVAGADPEIFTLAREPNPPILTEREGRIHRSRSLFEVASCDIGGPSAVMAFRTVARSVDLIHFHYPWPFGDLLAQFIPRGMPYVVTYHSDIVRQQRVERLYAPLRARFLGRASAVVATSQAYVSSSLFLKRLNRAVDVIPLSLDPADVPSSDEKLLDAWRAALPGPFFLFVGVLRYYKGLDYLIEAARLNGLKVVIAGDGPEAPRLARLAADLPNVHFLGRISDEDKYALLRLCRSVVFPSHLRSEAFGVTLLEGAVCGAPLISTEIGTGTSYVNKNGVTGMVVPPANASALAQAMSSLAHDKELAISLGCAARERCLRLFNTVDIGRSYADIYRRVLGTAG